MIRSLALSLVLFLSAFASRACAQNARDVLQLSRIAVSESGFDSEDDHRAILEVLRDVARRMGGVPVSMAAERYSSRVTGAMPPLNLRQAWIAELDLEGSEPSFWPPNGPPWAAYRAKWLAVVSRSRRLLVERGGPGCGAHHWGDAKDAERARRYRWIEVNCGETKNYFFRVPSDRSRAAKISASDAK